jgi:hypothetical protein
MVILDDFENPFMIEDVKAFLDKIFTIYAEATNRYHHRYILLKSNRSISKMMEL